MAFAHGRSGYFKLATNDLSAYTDNVGLTHEADTHETTTYGKTYKTRAGGLKDATFSAGGLYDSAAGGPETIIPPLLGTSVAVEWGPEGNTTAKVKYTGNVVVKSYEQSVPVGDMIRWTATFEMNDTLTKGTFV